MTEPPPSRLRRRPSWRRRSAAVVCACLLAAIAPGILWSAPASAHNGVGAAFAGTAGPYTVYAYDGVADQPGALLYGVVVRDTATGAPVDGAVVTVTADRDSGQGKAPTRRGPLRAEARANVYQYELPDPGTRLWSVHLTVAGEAGAGAVTFKVHGTGADVAPPARRSFSIATMAGAAALAVLLGGAMLHRRGRSA